jgi:hypothetical protein
MKRGEEGDGLSPATWDYKEACVERVHLGDKVIHEDWECYYRTKNWQPLPESEALPSVGFFAECLLSGT